MPATNRRLKLLAAAALAVSLGAGIAAAAGAVRPAPAPMPRAGGYGDVAVTDPDVKAAASFGVARLHRPRARLAGIDAAQQQVVAGMNYRIDVTLTDRTRWRLSIYRTLRGGMKAGPAERLGPLHRRR